MYYTIRVPPLLQLCSRGRFHEKSQTEPDSRLSQGLKSETFVSAEFLAQMDRFIYMLLIKSDFSK